MMEEQRSKILSGAPFITSRWLDSLSVDEFLWIESWETKVLPVRGLVNSNHYPFLASKPKPNNTWYLLVELKGISAILLLFSLISWTDPQHSSIHFRSADSEASPATSLWRRKSTVSPEAQAFQFGFKKGKLSMHHLCPKRKGNCQNTKMLISFLSYTPERIKGAY